MRFIILSVAFLAILGSVLAQDEPLSEDARVDEATESDELDLDEISRAYEADDTEENEDEEVLNGDGEEDDSDETKRADVETRALKRYWPRNCRDIFYSGRRRSGIYRIYVFYRYGWIRRVTTISVYCQMTLHGGPYTFIPLSAILKYPTLILKYIVTNKKKVLLVGSLHGGSQHYTILEQLNAYKHLNLGIKINSYSGYTRPVNAPIMDRTYLFVGFIPRHLAANYKIQGFTSNNKQLTFKNCDKNPNSYFAFFPNHYHKTPSSYGTGWHFKLVTAWANSAKPLNPRIPSGYFFFAEMHFGGCGAYWQSNRTPAAPIAVGFA